MDGGIRDADLPAGRTGADPVTLAALLTYLVSIELLALGGARAAVEEEARWIAPGVVRAHGWSAVPEVTATGPGSGTVANALVRAFPGLRARVTALPSVLRVLREETLGTDVLPHVELVPQTGADPAAGVRTLLMCRQLAWPADEDAEHLLAGTAAALPADGTFLLVEQVTAADPDDADAPLDQLRLKCAFGSGVRDVAGLAALVERAGLTVGACHDIGWDHCLWVLTAPGRPGRR